MRLGVDIYGAFLSGLLLSVVTYLILFSNQDSKPIIYTLYLGMALLSCLGFLYLVQSSPI